MFLELQVVLSYLTQVLGTEFRSSGISERALTDESSLHTPVFVLFS